MTHSRCNLCKRKRIVVVLKNEVEVLEHHYRKTGRKGGTCKGTSLPARRDQVVA